MMNNAENFNIKIMSLMLSISPPKVFFTLFQTYRNTIINQLIKEKIT